MLHIPWQRKFCEQILTVCTLPFLKPSSTTEMPMKCTVMILSFLDRKVWTNSADPDQTAPRAAKISGVPKFRNFTVINYCSSIAANDNQNCKLNITYVLKWYCILCSRADNDSYAKTIQNKAYSSSSPCKYANMIHSVRLKI